ncbi:hypothetical protein ACS0TY_028670 [Phlomoides rotata]
MIPTKIAANSSVHVTGRGKKKSVPSSRRVWIYEKEMELVCASKELVVRGLKCDNGFKSDYLNLLENILASKFPSTDLKGDPHINSKIHVWKKQYACLKSMLGVSGIGLNSTTYHIDALPDADPTTRGLKHKTSPFYNDWLEVTGNDRATGGDSQAYVDVEHEIENESNKPKGSSIGDDQNTEIHNNYEFTTADPASFTVGESSYATKDKGKGLKRKQVDNLELQFIDTMINFSDKTDSRFGQLANTMGCIAKRVDSEYDACNRRGHVYE